MTVLFDTPRLRVRTLARGDLDWLARLHAHPEVMRHVRAPDTRAQTAERLERLLAETAADPRLGVRPAERRHDGAVIGWFVLTELDGGDEIELGFRLFPEFWGQGLATEGARALARHGFEAFDLPRLVAVARLENPASLRVLEKAGFRREGTRWAYGRNLAFFERRRGDLAPG